MRAVLLSTGALLVALAASAQPREPGGKSAVPVPQDLLSVLTLRGKPCGNIASYERKGESDYFVTCSDGHRYRIFIGQGDRVTIEER